MKDPAENPFREKTWRGPLSPADEARWRAWIAAHPDAEADARIEADLTRLLSSLPDTPVAGNFAARVRQALERQSAPERLRGGWGWRLRSWLPKMAFAAVLLSAGWLGYHEHESARRARLARSVAMVSEVASLPSPEVLQDFEVIRQLNQPAQADPEVLALMQ